MPCVVCGDVKTCRAHIQPAALGKDIIKQAGRKTLSLAVPDRMDNSIQSGLFDDNILCSGCDGKLGVFDHHAIGIKRLLGTAHEIIDRKANYFTIACGNGVNHEQLALFGAAVVWRASISRYRELSQFTLGNNEAWFRDMLFRQSTEIPTVLIARLVGANALTHEAAMTALSYPQRIKIRGISLARFITRGLSSLFKRHERQMAHSVQMPSQLLAGVLAQPASLGFSCPSRNSVNCHRSRSPNTSKACSRAEAERCVRCLVLENRSRASLYFLGSNSCNLGVG